MMKFLFCTLLSLPLFSFANPQYYLGLDSGNGATLWLDQKNIEKKTVYILGHRSIENKSFETAIPADEYKRLLSEMKNWMDPKNQHSAPIPGPGCKEAVYFEAKGKSKFTCFDFVKDRENAKFTSWYKKTVRLALGMF